MYEEKQEPIILGWCDYCKCKVLFTENYRMRGHKVWHEFCFHQKNTHPDIYG